MSKKKCKTCRDSGEVPNKLYGWTNTMQPLIPCPDCQPKCETCGGSGRKPRKEKYHCRLLLCANLDEPSCFKCDFYIHEEPCPDCPPEIVNTVCQKCDKPFPTANPESKFCSTCQSEIDEYVCQKCGRVFWPDHVRNQGLNIKFCMRCQPKPDDAAKIDILAHLKSMINVWPMVTVIKDDLEQAADRIEQLQAEIAEAKKGAFGFVIRSDETLLEGINRNYVEFDDERTRLNKLLEQALKAKEAEHGN